MPCDELTIIRQCVRVSYNDSVQNREQCCEYVTNDLWPKRYVGEYSVVCARL